MPTEYEEQMAFEAEVRRVAEAVFGMPPGGCQPAFYTGDPILHELDGIARQRDVTHLIMATVSRRLDKAKEDIQKLNAAEKIEFKRRVAVNKWFITREELNAEHIQFANKNNVKALTLESFRNHFFDGRDYIAKRRVGAFGSARNLRDGSITIDDKEYVELPMVWRDSARSSDAAIQLATIADRLRGGSIVVVVAPFGSG